MSLNHLVICSNHKVVVVAALLVAAAWMRPALAEDPEGFPPWWDQAGWMNVSLGYDFDDPGAPFSADPYNVPEWYGYIGRQGWTLTGDAHWIEGDAENPGKVGIEGPNKKGTIELVVWNIPSEDNKKILTVRWKIYNVGGKSGDPPSVTATPGIFYEGSTTVTPGDDLVNHDNPDGSRTRVKKWIITPQPFSETIKFEVSTPENAPADAHVYIDGVRVTTKCEKRPGTLGCSLGYNFATPDWPPLPVYEATGPGYEGTDWERTGNVLPDWIPDLAGQHGVLGLPGGMLADGLLVARFDDLAEPAGVQYVAYSFDFWVGGGGGVFWELIVPPGCIVGDVQEEMRDRGNGWWRIMVACSVSPPPDWEELRWYMHTDPGTGPVAIDNLHFGAGNLAPASWFEDFEFCETGSGMHGQRGWQGWDNNPANDAPVSEAYAQSGFRSVEIIPTADLVHPFAQYTTGKWEFRAHLYVPGDFQSGGFEPWRGSFCILLNTYPATQGYHWSAQLHVDSDTDTIIRDGLVPTSLPLIYDEWTELKLLIDLDQDYYRVFYNGIELGVAESWTASVYGGGGGAVNIGAVDLYANNSTPVYYDDFTLLPVFEKADLNCDGAVNAFDIDPFVLALTASGPGYWEYYGVHIDCDRDLADCNGDGVVDAFDIDPFVVCLVNGGCP